MTDHRRGTPPNMYQMDNMKNIATNGRLFSILLVAVNISMGSHALAVAAALPVGLSCIIDQLPRRIAQPFSLFVYVFTAIVAIITFMMGLM